MKVLLVSTYELGRQPFGLGSPAAWLRGAGHEVACLDLSRQALAPEPVRAADLIAFFVPMHTATRLAAEILPAVRQINARAKLAFYGLYAPVNEDYLRSLGADFILGGEFEEGLVRAAESEAAIPAGRDRSSSSPERTAAKSPPLQTGPSVSLARQQFLLPDRAGLPPLRRYARLILPRGEKRTVGYTEASRGCKHLCRHCPIVPVYNGVFRIVQPEVVLADVRQQVAAGAEHITFGDPDFFNGPRHAIEIVRALRREFPGLTYDVTIKISHLLEHAGHLRTLRETGCALVTSAVESVDDEILLRLDKGHTYADFVAVLELFREIGLALAPTFVPFTPWTTVAGYRELLERLAELELVESVAPIQLAIRLLIPAGSRLLELEDVRARVGPFDRAALVYPWRADDPRVDALAAKLQAFVQQAERKNLPRRWIFKRVWEMAHEVSGLRPPELPSREPMLAHAAVPYLTEPWYC